MCVKMRAETLSAGRRRMGNGEYLNRPQPLTSRAAARMASARSARRARMRNSRWPVKLRDEPMFGRTLDVSRQITSRCASMPCALPESEACTRPQAARQTATGRTSASRQDPSGMTGKFWPSERFPNDQRSSALPVGPRLPRAQRVRLLIAEELLSVRVPLQWPA